MPIFAGGTGRVDVVYFYMVACIVRLDFFFISFGRLAAASEVDRYAR